MWNYDAKNICTFAGIFYKSLELKYMNLVYFTFIIRDGPFDIRGAGIFLVTSYFFYFILHNKLFFSKVNCYKFFIYFREK